MSYEETHHFALVSQNNKHIKKYINLQDVERRPCYVHLKKNSIKMFIDTYFISHCNIYNHSRFSLSFS